MLFPQDLQKDESQQDNTQITQVLLYFSEDEAREFKRLCKLGMVHLMPSSFQASNISDFLLQLLKTHYGNK